MLKHQGGRQFWEGCSEWVSMCVQYWLEHRTQHSGKNEILSTFLVGISYLLPTESQQIVSGNAPMSPIAEALLSMTKNRQDVEFTWIGEKPTITLSSVVDWITSLHRCWNVTVLYNMTDLHSLFHQGSSMTDSINLIFSYPKLG